MGPTPQTHTMMKAWFDRMLFPLTRPGRAVKALESSPPDRLQATVLHALGGCPLGDDAQMLQDLEVETEATLEVVIDYETLRSKVETIEASRKQEAEAEAEKQRRKEEQERKVREKAERRRTERQQRKAREDARRRHEARYWDAAIRRRQQSIAFRNPVPIATVPCGY